MSARRARRGAVRRSAGALAALGLAALVVVAGAAGPASAHNFLVSATPQPGSTVTSQPGSIVVTTNDTLLQIDGTDGFGMLVQDADGRYYGDGCVDIEGASLSMSADLGTPGTYTVTWQVVSTDGHPVSSSYEFTWKPAADADLATGVASAPSCATGTGSGDESTPAASSTDAAHPASHQHEASDSTVWWIIGAAGAVAVAVVIVLLVVRPRRDEEDDEVA